MSSRTLVLTPWYFPYRIVGWQDAITLVYLNKVDVVVCYAEMIRSPSTAIQLPAVVRMRRAVRAVKRRVRFSRLNIYLRDGFSCAYCAAEPGISALTWDHVVPRSQGGRTDWENILTACTRCNAKKANRTPLQAGMPPLKQAYRPRSLPFPPPLIDVASAPPEWTSFTAMLPAIARI
jgi:5-methylcytosine-specific restriction endonuclease McrA